MYTVDSSSNLSPTRPILIWDHRKGAKFYIGIICNLWNLLNNYTFVESYILSYVHHDIYFYFCRTITLTFEPGQRLRSTSVEVLEDFLPENTETFFVTLVNPTGGATIGPKNKISVNILSNDNAHGIIEFAEVWILQNNMNEIEPYILKFNMKKVNRT